MSKVLSVAIKIANHSTQPMRYESCWYEHGGPDNDWPMVINSGDEATVVSSANSAEGEVVPGVGGYVVYVLNGQNVAIAFSNPTVGFNKLNVDIASPETGGKNAFDELKHHGEAWAKTIIAGDKAFNVALKATPGLSNEASVTFYLASQ